MGCVEQGKAKANWGCRLVLEGELLLCLDSVSGETITAVGEAGDGSEADSPGQLKRLKFSIKAKQLKTINNLNIF